MKNDKAGQNYFTRQLMHWHETENDRSLPWKEEKDPYKIWLSEIILQQTRSEQGRPYYLNFISNYPTIQHLAGAPEEDVFRLWQGLGYYNRCKNMLATARHISTGLNGTFPDAYEDILKLKGIGPYTAAAIASFAYNLPHAVVDGNVYRVLARYFGIDTPSDTTEGKKIFYDLAQELLDKKNSAAYNQAIMDFGATICTPSNPRCSICPLQKQCIAYRQNLISLLPVKSKKQTVRKRYFNYLLLTNGDDIWINKRTGKDIWQNLHELLLFESEKELDKPAARQSFNQMLPVQIEEVTYEGALTQRLTHQLIQFRFYSAAVETQINIPGKQGNWLPRNALKNLGFPKSIVSFLEKKLYF